MKYFVIFLVVIGFIGIAFAEHGELHPEPTPVCPEGSILKGDTCVEVDPICGEGTTLQDGICVANETDENVISSGKWAQYPSNRDIPPPLKQMQLGIKLGHIICDEDKIPTWNVHFKPACVFPDSENKLLERGWAKLRLMLPASADPIKELERTGQNEVTYRILGNIRVNDQPPPSTLDEKRKIVWEYAQKYHPGERFLEYSIPTSGMYHFNVGDKIQFEIMEWGNYSKCWDLNVQIFNTNNDVLYEDTLNKSCLEPDGKPGWFSSYSVGKDSEIICEKPGYYMIEVSNGEIFPPTILQNFACLKSESQQGKIDEFYPVDPADIVNANNQFAIDFYSEISQNNENIFFSPTSISTAFSILYEGAKENTADEIQDVFGFPKNELERKHGYHSLHKIINENNNENVQLHIVNALWLAKSFEPLPEYLNTATKYYDSTVTSVDFVSDDGVNKINDWVKSKTEEKIEKLLEPGSTGSNTRMAITNAIYFKGVWEHPFDPEDTYEADFMTSPEETVKVQMMTFPHKMKMNVARTEQMQMLELPYKNNTASMLIILPNEIDGLKSVEDSLTLENLENWKSMLSKIGSGTVIHIPKFSLETDYNLKETLPGMGMPSAFNIVHADLSGITGYKGLYISQAVHKAFVDVNEEGTEAAGATAIVTDESGGRLFKADHPFIFIIQDKSTNSILFIGKIVNPAV